ncbi:S-adenosyl-L-methionine-dependent methyltransferase [Arabidopsis suecica]|uniref:S-adenosyl-L-methionine-dependent methyltransferase n=1 Tax=Arabidopsis suecica TaxID=45249 RepID=A0A8T2AIU5_ARASU|nr:S-adenosyl-L-methionine-dependent methyltransferase [Arabidopsis suecica]
MGKREKKPNRRRHKGEFSNDAEDFYDQHPPVVASVDDEDEEENSEEEEDENCNEGNESSDLPSKFLLYQQSVQSPKGDISYLQKFFLMYVGGRQPLHFQEDFCGTALLSAEWLKTDTRRTAIGLDFDLEALEWCMDNNISKLGSDVYSRMSLFHGNVLSPLEAKQVKSKSHELIQNISLDDGDENEDLADPSVVESLEKDGPDSLPKRDIVCAFNFSCCCLHKRSELVSYFKNALDALSKKGGIFVMDLYGGASAEGQLKLQRKFPNFTYTWEQAEFDILSRKTRISLHYHLQKQNRKIRHAFSYSWRLWSLPEIKDCMEEAGFSSVHFWLREMPDASEMRRTDGFGAGRDIKYEQVKSFQQCDSWNAYIVAVSL